MKIRKIRFENLQNLFRKSAKFVSKIREVHTPLMNQDDGVESERGDESYYNPDRAPEECTIKETLLFLLTLYIT
mgnify:CR=1 FL=1